MTDKLLIERELLERLAGNGPTSTLSATRELREILAAPHQPEGEGLEVVAWQDAENPLYTTAERRVLHDWANNGYPIVELCRLSDHLRAIAELREECERVKADRASCWAEFKVMTRSCLEAEAQRDKLARLLADVKADYTHAIHWGDLHATMKRIDAALAEIENTQ